MGDLSISYYTHAIRSGSDPGELEKELRSAPPDLANHLMARYLLGLGKVSRDRWHVNNLGDCSGTYQLLTQAISEASHQGNLDKFSGRDDVLVALIGKMNKRMHNHVRAIIEANDFRGYIFGINPLYDDEALRAFYNRLIVRSGSDLTRIVRSENKNYGIFPETFDISIALNEDKHEAEAITKRQGIVMVPRIPQKGRDF